MNKKPKMFRHGDILLRESTMPGNFIPKNRSNRFVVAEGEATGHMHELVRDPEA